MTNSLSLFEVLDTDGKNVAISQLWSNQTTVLAFLRHFG